MFNSRKGISPLVATILLVAFSIALGALVMSWGEDYISQRAAFVQGVSETKTGCDAVDLSIIQVGGQPQICEENNTIEIWLSNGPNIDLYNIHAQVVGFLNVQTNEEILSAPLAREDAVKTQIVLDKDLGQILQVKLTPKIFQANEVISCPSKALTIERLPIC